MSSAVLQHLRYSVFMNNKKPIRFVENVNQTFGKEAFRIEKRDGVMCLIGPDVNSSYKMNYPNVEPEVGTKIKEYSAQGEDPAGPIRRTLSIGTPVGRRVLLENSYREYFGEEVYTFECTKEDLPWAFAQFGMEYISE